MKNSYILFPIIISIFVLLSACSPATVSVQPSPVFTNNNPEATSTLQPTIAPTLTAIRPTVTVEPKCPALNQNTKLNLSAEPSEINTSILNYLNQGGDPTKAQPTPAKPELPDFQAISADIDGDSIPEVIGSTSNLDKSKAVIGIYHCQQNSYSLVKSFVLERVSFAEIEFTTKIFPSEPPFAIAWSASIIGWGEHYLAIGWHDSEWQIIDLATGFTPSEIALFDQNEDGIKEVFIKTKTAVTPGGGIGREIINSYSWNGTKFIENSSDMPPGPDRVHFLQDAEIALKHGNPLLAITYYEIAARDSSLPSYWTTYEIINKQTKLSQPYQQAYAFFRIVVIWLNLDRPEIASKYIQEMSDAFPRGKVGNEFVLAAQEMYDDYKKDALFSPACAKAANFLDAQYPDIVGNHLGDWGVANPMFSKTSDICKFK